MPADQPAAVANGHDEPRRHKGRGGSHRNARNRSRGGRSPPREERPAAAVTRIEEVRHRPPAAPPARPREVPAASHRELPTGGDDHLPAFLLRPVRKA